MLDGVFIRAKNQRFAFGVTIHAPVGGKKAHL